MPESTDLTNPRAERVRRVRALAGRPARLRHGQFLVEGPQGVREVVSAAPETVRDLYVGPQAARRYGDVVARARAAGVRVHEGTAEVLDAMSPDAQQLLAVVRDRPVALDVVLRGAPSLVAVLAHVRDPGNAGAVVRTADAAGADAVVLTTGSVDLHSPKTVRATAGSLFHVPVVTEVEVAEVVERLRTAGLTVLAADGRGEHDLDDLLDGAGSHLGAAPSALADPPKPPDLARPTAWLFGNEAWGLHEDVRTLVDAVVRVPIHGRAESLNLATAAAVCLYASARSQRSTRPQSRPGASR